MKKTLIIILVIVILIAGWIFYLYRDSIRNVYDNTSADVKEEMVDIKEDINETIWDVKENVSEGIADVKEEATNQ